MRAWATLILLLCMGCGSLKESRLPPYWIPLSDEQLLSDLLFGRQYVYSGLGDPVDLILLRQGLMHRDHLLADTEDHTGHGLRICPEGREHFASDVMVCPIHHRSTEPRGEPTPVDLVVWTIAAGIMQSRGYEPKTLYKREQLEVWLEAVQEQLRQPNFIAGRPKPNTMPQAAKVSSEP